MLDKLALDGIAPPPVKLVDDAPVEANAVVVMRPDDKANADSPVPSAAATTPADIVKPFVRPIALKAVDWIGTVLAVPTKRPRAMKWDDAVPVAEMAKAEPPVAENRLPAAVADSIAKYEAPVPENATSAVTPPTGKSSEAPDPDATPDTGVPDSPLS